MAKRPSKAVIIKELEQEIGGYRQSYSELDGEIYDLRALKTIACLEAAVEIVRASTPNKPAGDPNP